MSLPRYVAWWAFNVSIAVLSRHVFPTDPLASWMLFIASVSGLYFIRSNV